MSALKSLNPYLWKNRKRLFLGVIFIFLSNFFSIYPIKYVGKAVDIISSVFQKSIENSQKDILYKELLFYSLIIICAPLIAGILKFLMRQTIIVASRKIEFELKNNIYSHYQQLSYTFYKKSKIGDLLNRISEDIVNVRQYLGPGIMYSVNLTITILMIVFFMWREDKILTIAALLPLPFLSLFVYRISSINNKKTKKLQASMSDISSFVQDSFSGIRIIKSFVKENYITSLYSKKVDNYQKKALSLALTEALFPPLTIIIIGLSNVAVLYLGGYRFIEGKISIGSVTNFFLYLNLVAWPFTAFGWVASINRRAEASMERINEFLESNDVEVDKTDNKAGVEVSANFQGSIRFENVSYTYPNTGIKALDQVSFEVKVSERVAIIGKTGSGKSTIGFLLTRLIQPDSGTIYLDNIPIQDYTLKDLREKISYVPQENFLFSDTVYNNIAYGISQSTDKQIIEAAKNAEIDENIERFEKKYQTEVGERGITLSGGQKQRISIARALIKNSNIFIFDDSLSAVDAKTEEKILNNIHKIGKKTVILITHRLSFGNTIDRILIMDNGKIKDSDLSPKEINAKDIEDLLDQLKS